MAIIVLTCHTAAENQRRAEHQQHQRREPSLVASYHWRDKLPEPSCQSSHALKTITSERRVKTSAPSVCTVVYTTGTAACNGWLLLGPGKGKSQIDKRETLKRKESDGDTHRTQS
jgi:hypothetical protein